MNPTMKNHRLILFLPAVSAVLATLLASSCGRAPGPETSALPAGQSAPQLAAYFTDARPAGAIPVRQLRQQFSPGTEVVVEGIVAGVNEPFSPDYAVFVLADRGIQTCDTIPGDRCPSPWDACCADPAALKESRITVQVSGPDGTPIPATLKGVHGMAEMDRMVVEGRVSDQSNSDNVILEAARFYRVPDGEAAAASGDSG